MTRSPTDPDTLTLLSHRLIRRACSDGFDPFMLPGGPLMERDGIRVRACFYYAVILTPKTTVLLDNLGRGGMCDLLPHEIVAAWPTQELLDSQGLRLEDLDAPSPPAGAMSRDVPSPREVFDDLDEGPEKWRANPAAPEDGPLPVSQLLRSDVRLLLTMLEANTSPEPSGDSPETIAQEPTTESSPSRRPSGPG